MIKTGASPWLDALILFFIPLSLVMGLAMTGLPPIVALGAGAGSFGLGVLSLHFIRKETANRPAWILIPQS